MEGNFSPSIIIFSFPSRQSGYNARWEGISLEAIKSQMGTILDVPEGLKLPEKELETMAGLPENFDSRE